MRWEYKYSSATDCYLQIISNSPNLFKRKCVVIEGENNLSDLGTYGFSQMLSAENINFAV